jgi:hypothetical protein
MTSCSGAGAAGGSSRKVLETLIAITPSAMAMDRENTAIKVSFQCLPRIRIDRRARMEILCHSTAPGRRWLSRDYPYVRMAVQRTVAQLQRRWQLGL